MDHNMVLSYDTAIEIGGGGEQMHLHHWLFRKPWRCDGAIMRASPDGAHRWLHAKPLDAAIGRVLAPYRPCGCHGHRCRRRVKTQHKTQLLATVFAGA